MPELGTNEPTTAADRANDTAPSMDEPRHPVPPLPETRTNDPARPTSPPLKRHQRRRLAALARRELRPAA
jgi:hypothetical protein